MLIGLEASGHYWMSLWRFLLERDWQVQVFNPLLSSKSARTHLRGRKTDADDALFIARTVRDGDFIPLRPGASPAASGWRPKGAWTRGIFTSKADIARYIEAHNKGAPNSSNGPTGRRIR